MAASEVPGYLLWRLTMKWRAAADRALTPLGLTHAQYSLLASLYGLSRRGAQPSQRQLADFAGLEPIYVSKLARALETAGLLTRIEHPHDPRAVQLALTPAGAETALRAIAVIRDLQQENTAPIGGLDSPRTRQLVETLKTLLGDGSDIMTQPPALTGQDIAEAQGALRGLLEGVLAPTGVSGNGYLALRVLTLRGPMAPGDLRDFLAGQRQLGLDPAGAAALLDDLAARGLIGVGDDGLTRTTQEGAALHTRLSETIAPITGQVFGDFDPADLEVAHRVLNEVMRRADEVRAGL
ncbi:MarR family transcriptional regulator [Nonomuraea soli]|uniref:DNA-binding MarR family transcriptional regulator n=1 Tax=Nonomuraea soli TaxID=1032476 RepID=A0A7W0HRA6_9ACTN|nr:MarR family transcriptional regulator [Nonomuraea soli]MBA2892750.1 DNA-binding MarR family transcriptional regulator [Nonomuraea soli]